MFDQERIPLGRVRWAYELTPHRADDLIQALCPHAVFPLELWHRAFERFWKDFARAEAIRQGVECPVLPDVVLEPDKHFHSDLCGFDVMTFFRNLSMLIDSKIVKNGLEYILSETFDTFDAVYPEDRDILFGTLQKMEKRGPDHDIYDGESIDEEVLCLPAASYHFISRIFFDTILVDRTAVVLHLRDFPLLHEVKGLTHAFVKSVLNPPKEKAPDATTSTQPQEQATTPRSTGSKKDYERINATRQACGEIIKELLAERQLFETDRKNWTHTLIFDNGKTLWETFIQAVETQLGSKPHGVTAREEWKKVPGSLKHNGRMREQ